MKGLVLKKNADKFTVKVGKNREICTARNLKEQGIFVGDEVDVENGVIEKVFERKNLLVRPPLANVDKMIIVIAKTPKPDFLLVDKLLVFCTVNGIKPLLCLNKSDLGQEFVDYVEENYQNATKIITVSTLDETVFKLEKEVEGITTLAGQSAVGKSSIINALLKEKVTAIGDFSKKVERGKQTTRLVELYEIAKGRYLADTAGFSKLDERLLDVDEYELRKYYPEFIEPSHNCKYKSCLHLSPIDCGVCQAVKDGKVSELRYENYKILQNNIKNAIKF